ncbi:hypothetical protein [Vibrio sonorensis]|uniref:hypothetical protein n=1 Tax=Vibrio sonorensis TaxID=1004316 RepID=UPI0008D9DEFF|nr:hypothetical protein [Vibrio sonorensis]
MGIHLGTSNLVVLSNDVTKSILGIADHYPSALNERVSVPTIDEKYVKYVEDGKFEAFDTEKKGSSRLSGESRFYL